MNWMLLISKCMFHTECGRIFVDLCGVQIDLHGFQAYSKIPN